MSSFRTVLSSVLWTAVTLSSAVPASAQTAYQYDSLNRLTAATYPDGTQIVYSYDAAGNRRSTIVQAGCTYVLAANNARFPAEGGSGSVSVATAANCPWTAGSNSAFVTLAGGGGSGTAALTYTVGSGGAAPRNGSLVVAGQLFFITQDAGLASAISQQPRGVAILSGATAQLGVLTEGTPPLSYQWYRYDGSSPVPIAGQVDSQFTTPALTATTRYFVHVTNAFGGVSSESATVTVVPPFANGTLTAASSAIRAVHITELRARIEALRVAARLPAYSWTDPGLGAGTLVRGQHLTDLREALHQVYVARGVPPPVYSTGAVNARVTIIRAADILELRAAVIALELS